MTSRRAAKLSLIQLFALVFSLAPAMNVAAAPVLNNATRVWTDTFTDATGVTLVNTVHDAPGQRIVLDRQALPFTGTVGAVPVTVPGNAVSVTVVGNTLYAAAETSGLLIYDIGGDPTTPAFLGSLVTTTAEDVAVTGNTAYVADGTAGVRVIDVANPAAPSLLTTLPSTGSDTGLFISGTLLYVARGTLGVGIYDITAPAAPVFLGGVADPNGAALDVAVTGTTVLLAQQQVAGFGAGLVVVDAANPAAPTVLSSIATAQDAVEVAVSGTTAYLARTTVGLWTVDVSNPASPSTQSLVATPGNAEGVALAGANTVAVSLGVSGVGFFNVTNPTAPIAQTLVDTQGTAHGTVTNGIFTYVADGNFITVIGAPSIAPAAIDAETIPVSGQGIELLFAGNQLFAAVGNAGILVFDVNANGSLTQTGSFGTAGPATGIALSGTTLFVALDGVGLAALDVTTPAAISLLGTLPLADAEDVSIVGNRALVAAGSADLVVVDISAPAAMVQSAALALAGNATSIALNGTSAYIGTDTAGMQVVNIANVNAPLAAGSVATTGAVRDLEVVGFELAVAATDSAALFNVTAPLAPVLQSTITLPEANGVSMNAGVLSVAGGSQLTMYNITNPNAPVLLGALAAGGSANDVLLSGATIYGATDTQILVFGSVYLAAGTATSSVIAPASVTTWNEVVIGETIPANTDITYDVLNGATSAVLLAAVNPVGGRIDISGINAVANPTLRLRANFTTSDTAITPALNDWTVTWDGPCLVATSPVNTAVNVDRNFPITLTFSEPIDAASLTFTSTFAGVFTRVANGNDIVLTPTTPYPASTLIGFSITFAANAGGNRVTCFNVPNPFSFTTGLFLGPRINTTGPIDGAINVDRLAPVVVTFSSPMVPGSVVFTCSSGGPFAVVWSAGNTVATYTHSTLFAASAVVTCQVTAGADTIGRTLQPGPVPNPWTFTTGAFARPYIVTTNPADGALNVDRLAPIVVTFSDPMNIATVTLACTSGGPFAVTWDITNTIATYTHAALFAASTAVTCTSAGTGANGIALQAGPVPNPWTFNTDAFARPYVVTTSPVNGAVNVDRLASVIATFSDPMNPVTVTLNCTSGAPFTISWDITNTIATFAHTTLFPANTLVTCTLGGTGANGIALQAGPVPNPFSFTTGPVARPYIVSTAPANGAVNVPVTQSVVVTFSDAIVPASLGFTCSAGAPFTAVWSVGNTVVTLAHIVNFPGNSVITCQVTAAQDTLGRNVVTSLVPNPWSFSTQSGVIGNGTEFTITAFVGGSRGSNTPGGYGSVDDNDDDQNDNDDDGDNNDDDEDAPFDCEFRDVPSSHWAVSFIREVCRREIVSGYPDDTYRPQLSITRAEFLKMVLRTNKIDPSQSGTKAGRDFSDVTTGHSLYRYIQEGARLGVIHGYSDGSFRPNAPVSRAEAVKILFNAAGVKVGTDTRTSFEDVQATDWFASFVAYAERMRIVDGDNNRFGPYQNLTRAEAAKLITKALQLKITKT